MNKSSVPAPDQSVLSDIPIPSVAATKTYADMASRFWLAVGAALATSIGVAKRPG